MRKKNSVILREAKDVIRLDGWRAGPKGTLVDGPKCIMGAVAKAAGVKPRGWTYSVCGEVKHKEEYPLSEVMELPVAKALERCIGRNPWAWNDSLVRNVVVPAPEANEAAKQQVLEALNRCAISEEEAGR